VQAVRKAPRGSKRSGVRRHGRPAKYGISIERSCSSPSNDEDQNIKHAIFWRSTKEASANQKSVRV